MNTTLDMEDELNVDGIVTDGIKSKDRVNDFGEVFTPDYIVNNMVNLIPREVDIFKELAKTWLEPSCGTGNFFVGIFNENKFKVIEEITSKYSEYSNKNVDDLLFLAVSSVYGIDIQEDNVKESRVRVLKLVTDWYKSFTGRDMTDELKKSLSFVIDTNIVCANGLTGKTVELGQETNTDLLISEWKVNLNVSGDSTVKRSVSSFNSIVSGLELVVQTFDDCKVSEVYKQASVVYDDDPGDDF